MLTGENSVEGALRELSEEVGIHASKEELHLIHSICLKERFVDTYITRQNVNLEDLKLQAEEVVDAKFVVFDELMEMWRQGIVVPKSRFLRPSLAESGIVFAHLEILPHSDLRIQINLRLPADSYFEHSDF